MQADLWIQSIKNVGEHLKIKGIVPKKVFNHDGRDIRIEKVIILSLDEFTELVSQAEAWRDHQETLRKIGED